MYLHIVFSNAMQLDYNHREIICYPNIATAVCDNYGNSLFAIDALLWLHIKTPVFLFIVRIGMF